MDKAVFPAEMTALKQWICWRYEPNPNGGKDKKAPISSKTGKRALVNNPSTWAAFEEAVQAKEKYGYNGIGFVFTTDTNIVAIDIDDCFTFSLSERASSCANYMRMVSINSPSPFLEFMFSRSAIGKHPPELAPVIIRARFC